MLFYVLWSHQYGKHTATDPKSFCFTGRETFFFGICSLTGKTTDPALCFCLFLVVFVFLFDTQLKRERVKFENFRSPRNNWKVKGLEQSEKGEELLGNK